MKHILTLIFLFTIQLVLGQQARLPIIVKDKQHFTKSVNPTHSINQFSGRLAASNVIYTQDFESVISLSAAGISAKTKASDGGFKIGASAAASSGQVWKVPSNTKFVYTNDDVCNCNKSADSLVIPAQYLLGSVVYQLRFNAYFNGISNKEQAFVFAKNGGNTILLSVIKNVDGWEDYIIPLFGLTGNTQIVFSYSDGGLWSSGLALDDISICEPNESVNLGLESVWFNGFNRANAYKDYPAHQAAKMPLKIESSLINLGKNTATNTHVDVKIRGVGFSNQSSTPTSLLANSNALVSIYPNYIPAKGIGNYELLFIAKSDSVESETSTDSLTFNLNITDTIISRVGKEKPTSGFWFGPKTPYDLSSLVEITTPDSANSISVFINENSMIGDTFDLIILNEFFQDNVVPQVFPPVGTQIEVTTNHLGKWNTFKIPTTYLKTGKYYVGIRTYNGKVLVGVSESEAQLGVSFVNIGTGYASSNYLPNVKLNVKERSCAISANSSTKKSSCNLSTGSASVMVSGGLAPYRYQWTANAGSSTLNSVTALKSGVYTVTVSDSLGCNTALSVAVSDTNGPAIIIKNSINENCFGDLSGSLAVSASSGIAPFTFIWSNGQSDSTIQNLGSGTYTVTLTDSSVGGCKTIVSYAILGPKSPLSVDFVIENNICFNDTMGSIRVNANGGVPNYKFIWADTSKKVNVNSGLTSGLYRITITDANNCALVDSVNVAGSTPIVIALKVSDTINIGSIESLVIGGDEPLTYQWEGPNGFRNPGTKNLSDLIIRGNYTLKVIDANGCENSIMVELAGILGKSELLKIIGYKLYPNPSSETIFLDFGASISGQFAIYNLTGSLISEEQFMDRSVLVIDKPRNGVYILDLKTNETQVKYKLIFQD